MPSINLGYKRHHNYTTPERYERRQKRERLKSEHAAARSLIELQSQSTPEPDIEQEQPLEEEEER